MIVAVLGELRRVDGIVRRIIIRGNLFENKVGRARIRVNYYYLGSRRR